MTSDLNYSVLLGNTSYQAVRKTIYRIQYLYSSANPKSLFFLLILHLFLFLLHAHFCLCFDQEQTLVQQDDKGAGEEAFTQYREQSEKNCILPLEANKKFSVSHITPARIECFDLLYCKTSLQQPPSPCPETCHTQPLDVSNEALSSLSLHPLRQSLFVWMLTVTLPAHLKS